MENINRDLKVLIVDDDRRFLELLKYVLEEIGLTNVEGANDFKEGLALFKSFKPDVCLLDINLSDERKNGVYLAEYIRALDTNVVIIFLTSYFTDENYEAARVVSPSSFMNKELSKLKLYQAIELAVNIKDVGVVPGPERGAKPKRLPYFTGDNVFFKVGDSYKGFDLEEIDFFYSDQRITFGKIGGREFPTNVPLKTLENELKPTFLRCHKKFVVNKSKINGINVKDGSVEVGGEQLPIGYAYRKDFFDNLNLLK